jgi:DNA helicase-2/ATP-dependent DNA helicase PcrA
MNQAVLFRASHHSAQLEIELARRNIPFRKYGGLKFVEAAHIKDMLALLRILENQYDEISWFRVLQLLEGIGPRTAGRVMDRLGVRRVTGVHDGNGTDTSTGVSPLVCLMEDPPTVPPAARELFGELRLTLAQCCGTAIPPRRNRQSSAPAETRGSGHGRSVPRDRQKEPPLTTQIERIRRFYEPIFERTYENARARIGDLEQLTHVAAGYRSRTRFLSDLTLDPPEATSDLAGKPFLDEDYLILSTIHSAKGCEWTVVHIIHAADGMIPSDMAVGNEAGVDEERRLFYVAMTRAKNMLYVYFPLRYYHRRFSRGDAHSYAQLTRFMSEEVCSLFERLTGDCDGGTRLDDCTESPDHQDPAAQAMHPYLRVARLWRE